MLAFNPCVNTAYSDKNHFLNKFSAFTRESMKEIGKRLAHS